MGAIFVISTQALHIMEKQFQNTVNLLDEKLQIYDFKLKQYQKLINALNKNSSYSAKVTYIINNWFRKVEYLDFNKLPMSVLNLPI
ncbi:hypothetical protein AN639_08230 [Candidatus Epulonipiscium fishelsonii]|uniref:Uncharacterized protein n=1 Tax=Candidatus Epulonipiscium fishelsonii TaxID=77094 RepID=A0ACC8XBV1_9FIRM|nr:hypothetical protein AN639_08230 [Epulopiscium sp. SCG-B05WGA-EpuloA1]ONI40077.1 hypothetical protein AN396_06410 [Epulopiscium sp. SCG-B11WGA-EpuloA1]